MKLRQRDDLVGRRFGRVQVIAYVRSENGKSIWSIRCECGTVKNVRRGNVQRMQSCGCLIREGVAARSFTHGFAKRGNQHPLYGIWDSMKRRCHGSKPGKRYGQRGIYVCDRWRNGEFGKTGFECFLSDMGDRPLGSYSIDRKDNDGPYSPDNCRWATQTEQNCNKSTNRLVEFRGREMTLTEAVRLSGLTEGTVWGRLHLGWTIERALTIPPIRRSA